MKPVEQGSVAGTLVICPLCQSEKCHPTLTVGTDRLYECDLCSMVFAVSKPFDKLGMYTEAYFSGETEKPGYQNYEAEWISHHATFVRRLRSCERLLGRKGTLLDYGCAVGHLAKTAKDEGWRVFATDLSFYAVESAKLQYGINGFVSDLTKPPLRKRQFDLVTLYDVIEHVSDPHPILAQLEPLVKDHGLLHVTTPDVGSLSARVMGPAWYHFKEQEHLLYFSRATLQRALTDCRFDVVSTRVAPSSMTLRDIFVRLRRYSDSLANFGLRLLRRLGLENWVVQLNTGEMQSWARPRVRLQAVAPQTPRLERSAHYSAALEQLPVLEILCCPNCAGDLEPNPDLSELSCLGCHATFEVRNGIPILLTKPEAQKAAS